MRKPEDTTKKQKKKKKETSDNNVGYKKPPVHTRWQEGQSGNPGGRPKGSKSLKNMVYEIGIKPAKISINGETVEMSTIEAVIHKLWERAGKGDTKAFQILSVLFEAREKDITANPFDRKRHLDLQFRAFSLFAWSGIDPEQFTIYGQPLDQEAINEALSLIADKKLDFLF